MFMSTLDDLQKWYYSNCNNDWEHQYGIKISNIDNPGWQIQIDLTDTDLEEKIFAMINIDMEDELSWIHCKKANGIFDIACGPLMLEKSINIFLEWSKTN